MSMIFPESISCSALHASATHIVSNNADADVVKIFIYKEGGIALVLTQSVGICYNEPSY